MIVSRSFLSEFVELGGISTADILAKLNSIGLEVDGVCKLDISERVVVGYVAQCSKHENSDKLSVCMVDVGEQNGGVLQIVCGAANVCAGLYVAVALEGAQIGSLQIRPTILRGVQSNGMLCSSTELGLPKLNDGIMVLDDSIGELVIGKQINSYDVFCDEIIEVDITPNRGDCLSVRGVARDLAASFGLSLKEPKIHTDSENALGIGRVLGLHIDDNVKSEFAYKVIELKDELKINLKTSLALAHIQKLDKCAMQSLLNYASYATGVLMVAYDYAKLSSEEKITLDIKALSSGQSAVMHKDTTLNIAGICQSDEAKIDNTSKFIIIQAHYTHPDIIAHAHQQYKQKDIYNSFRGSEPRLSLGIDYLCAHIDQDIASIYTGVQQYQLQSEPSIISFTSSDISSCVGMELEKNEIVKILKSLGFDISVGGELISAKVPRYRHDIANTQDISEEIIRIIGIDNIPSKPLSFSEKSRQNACLQEYTKLRNIRQKAASRGYFESICYVMDNDKDLTMLGASVPDIKLLNPITAELNTLRSTLLSHLLKAASNNVKNFKKSIKLFECGSVFDAQANEQKRFAMVCSGLYEMASIYNHGKPSSVDFYKILQDLSAIIGRYELEKSSHACLSPYESANIIKNGAKIGTIGRLHARIQEQLDLPITYVCEIDTALLDMPTKHASAYHNTPISSRDLSLIAPRTLGYKAIKDTITALNIKILKQLHLVDIYTDAKLGDDVSMTISLVFQDSKTLEDSDVNAAIDMVLAALKSQLNIGMRE